MCPGPEGRTEAAGRRGGHGARALAGPRGRRPLAALGRGEAGLGAPAAPPAADTDTGPLGRYDGPREGGRGRRGHPGRVRVHPGGGGSTHTRTHTHTQNSLEKSSIKGLGIGRGPISAK